MAGRRLTASSSLLDDRPSVDCDVWARLRAQGMILLGHLHTHEFAFGGTTDQVANPWSLERSPGGSSGGSAAALAARMVPAATGTDTAGSLRIPSALCGTSTIKPTRGRISLRGVVPLATSLDHAGPMARTLEDCAVLLAGMAGPDPGRPLSALAADLPAPPQRRAGPRPLEGVRLALSPRAGVELDADTGDGLELALERCGPSAPHSWNRLRRTSRWTWPTTTSTCSLPSSWSTTGASTTAARDTARRSASGPICARNARSRPSGTSPRSSAAARRRPVSRSGSRTSGSRRWSSRPSPVSRRCAETATTVPARDAALISLTHYWDWTGFPVAALPAGVGARSGLPVSVSVIGPAGADWEVLDIGIQLQAELGVDDPYAAR